MFFNVIHLYILLFAANVPVNTFLEDFINHVVEIGVVVRTLWPKEERKVV